jgi:tetratricopeptide (TPR) repeat protein/serine/threonine protein kinase
MTEEGSLESLVARVVDEFLERQKRGERPDPAEYAARHPHAALVLREVLAALHVVGLSSAAGLAAGGGTTVGESPAGGTLGDFRILREIGRGGMGVVYEAEQISLCRRVALKVLPFAAAMDSKQLQRFKNEAQAAAHLHHTNIVPVFGVGCERGVHYYAMQFIEGQTLAKVIADLRSQNADVLKCGDRHREEPGLPPTGEYYPAPSVPQSELSELQSPIPPTQPVAGLSTVHSIKSAAYIRTVANLGVQAAEALEHAHDQGVIHRDIKPANLLVDGRGNLWVTDFGLAHCQNQAGLTMSGDLVGTLRYMSPEQALAKRVLIDHRTDVYSLGVTLYELLTLEPAYHGSDRQELLRQIAFEEPRPLRRLNKPVPAELETVVLKAMEKNPAERYATAQELADDLARFLEDKPIRAKGPTLLQRARKWSRRHKALVWAAAVVALMVVLLGTGNWVWWAQKRAALEREVRLAIQEAVHLQEQDKWPEALSAARRAAGLRAAGGVKEDLQQRVRELQADLEMVARLDDIRLLGTNGLKEGKFDIAVRDAKYAQAFREYGLDLETLDPSEAAKRIWTKSIALKLAATLDDWALVRKNIWKKDDAAWKKLLAMARKADPDLWRNQIRDAVEHEDRKTLGELAASEQTSEQSPSTLVLLGINVRRTGMTKEAVALLQKAQERHPADFDLNYELAVCLQQTRQHVEAIRFSSVAVALRPQSPGAYLHLGCALAENGTLEEAIRAFKNAIRLAPEEALCYYNLGLALQNKGASEEAIAACKEAIRLKPDYAGAYGIMGQAFKDKGALNDAIAAYKEEIRLEPDRPESHSDLGIALFMKGARQEAIAALKKAVELKPDSANGHYNLGVALDGMGALDKAIAAYKEAIRLEPAHDGAPINLAIALRKNGAFDESIAALRKALNFKPDNVEALYHLGVILCQKGTVDEGITTIKKAIQLKPDNARYHLGLGMALASKGQHEGAIASFRAAIDHDKHFASAHFCLGNELLQKDHLDEAITCYRQTIVLQEDDVEAHNNLGVALTRKGQPDEAIAYYQEAIRLDKNHASSHENLGERLYHNGRWAEADGSYRKALHLAPNGASINSNFAWFRANCPDAKFRNIPEAVQLAQRATELDPKNGEMWLALGVARYRAGQFQEAVSDLEKSAGLRPRDDCARRLFLAMAYWQLGDKNKAREFYRQAVEWLEKNQPYDPEELRRFRAEADQLLGIKQRPATQRELLPSPMQVLDQ